MSEEENISEYDKLWKRIRDSINTTAKDSVPQLFETLKQEGYSAKEARDKIKKDAFNIWKAETIDKWIPEEAKKEILVMAGRKGAEIKKEKARSDLGSDKPEEGKPKVDAEMISTKNSQQTVTENENNTTNDPLENIPERDPEIPPTDEYQDAESVEDVEDLRGNKTELVQDNIPAYIKLKLDQFDTPEQLLQESDLT